MRFFLLIIALAFQTAAVFLTGCSQPANYAPVKTANQALAPMNGYTPSPTPQPSSYNGSHEKNTSIQQRATAPRQQPPASFTGNAIASDTPMNPVLSAPGKAPDAPIMSSGSPDRSGRYRAISPVPKAKEFKHHGRPGSAPVKDKLSKPDKPYLGGQFALKDKKDSGSKQSDTRQLALLKLENNGQNPPKPQFSEKYSDNKKSILSNDNKKMLKLNFDWPIKGKITRNFGQTDNKGIEIRGSMGQEFRASEAGKAVYCGRGLMGFGNLAVIKHNETYLSAYANASRLYIKEGQHIGKGQAIGEIGDSGFKRALLHFEIRKNGKSINPLTALPKR